MGDPAVSWSAKGPENRTSPFPAVPHSHVYSGSEYSRACPEKPVEILLRPLTADYGGRDGDGKTDDRRRTTDDRQRPGEDDERQIPLRLRFLSALFTEGRTGNVRPLNQQLTCRLTGQGKLIIHSRVSLTLS